MKKNSDKVNEIATEIGKNYFSTPSTSLDKQRQVAGYDSFDISSEPYRKSTSRVIVRRYTVK
ncbi:MAG: hypothetical protein P4L79_14995 [Legionella sp.]|uniref:hypothetical protein n=1 Tax=Legionella sp. TaxID=459 RepID=UPI00285125CB|nr:hypothetical protein [Legionella sp.]